MYCYSESYNTDVFRFMNISIFNTKYIEYIKSRLQLIDLKSVRYIKSHLIILSHYCNSYIINFKNFCKNKNCENYIGLKYTFLNIIITNKKL